MRAGARLLWQADSILLLAAHLRSTSWVEDTLALRAKIGKRLMEFQARAQEDGFDAVQVGQATEVLCAMVDHVVTSMPWGQESRWKPLGKSKSSNPRSPAQRVVAVARAAASDNAVSELAYVALALGFDKSTQGADAADVEQTLARLAEKHRKMPVVDEVPRANAAPARPKVVTQLPRYLVLGAPGAGKTTALLNSGLKLSLQDLPGAAPPEKVQPTRDCDWYVADRAVFIDTPGRYMTQDADATADRREWQMLIQRLRTTQPKRPLDGVIVVVSAKDFLDATPEERAARAGALRSRLAELRGGLQTALPVYVLLSQCDELLGFVEWFSGLDRQERDGSWGITLPHNRTDAGNTALATPNLFETFVERLADRVVGKLSAERDIQRRARLFSFPVQLRSMRKPLQALVRDAFGPSPAAAEGGAVYLRGVYLTSATQGGTPMDRMLAAYGRELGKQRQVLPAHAGAGASYFIAGVLNDVVLAESTQGAALGSRGALGSRKVMVLAGAAAAMVAVGVGAWWMLGRGGSHARAPGAGSFAASNAAPTGAGANGSAANESGASGAVSGSGTADAAGTGGRAAGSGAAAAVDPKVLASQLDVRLATLPFKDFSVGAVSATAAAVFVGADGASEPVNVAGHYTLEAWRNVVGTQNAALIALYRARYTRAWTEFVRDIHLRRAATPKERAAQAQLLSRTDGPLAQLLAEVSRQNPANLPEGTEGPLVRTDESNGLLAAINALQVRGTDGHAPVDDVLRSFAKVPALLATKPASRKSDAAGAELARIVTLAQRQPEPVKGMLLAMAEPAAGDAAGARGIVGTAGTPSSASGSARELASDGAGANPALARGAGPRGTVPEGSSASAGRVASASDRTRESADDESASGSGSGTTNSAPARGAGSRGTSLASAGRVASASVPTREPVDDQAEPAPAANKRSGPLSQQIAARLSAPCMALVGDNFPFNRSAIRDSAISDFTAVLAPGGLFDTTFKDLLASGVSTSSTPWRWIGSGAGPAAADLERFRAAARVRDVFFTHGGAKPSLQLTFRPIDLDATIDRFQLDIDGQTVRYAHGPVLSTVVNWPGTAGKARVAVTPGETTDVIELTGPWALLRLFDRAAVQNTSSPGHYRVVFDVNGRRATFDVEVAGNAAASGANPFRLRELERFSCPSPSR